MTLPFSSVLPDAVQKSLGLSGGSGTVEEALVGTIVVVTVVWGLFNGILWFRKRKP
jgi:hypothetical protein